MRTTTVISTLALAASVTARTDLAGCTSSAIGASLLWYVPGTGEICSIPDCGGGRAPPKTTVPGCAAYVGTASYEPSYLPGYGPNGASATSSAAAATSAAAVVTGAASSSFVQAASTGAAASSGVVSSAVGSSTLSTVTTAPAVILSTGTGGIATGSVVGGNNLTATATLSSASSGAPVATGAANALSARELLGLAVGAVAGLAML